MIYCFHYLLDSESSGKSLLLDLNKASFNSLYEPFKALGNSLRPVNPSLFLFKKSPNKEPAVFTVAPANSDGFSVIPFKS